MRAALTHSILALAVALGGCAAMQRGKRGAGKKKGKAPNAAALTMAEVAEEEPLKVAGAGGTATARRLSAEQIRRCQSAVAQLVPPHKALFALLPPATYAPAGSPADAVLAVTPAHCQDQSRRAPALAALNAAISQHSGRIGVILPLTGPRAKVAAFLVEGMRAAFQEAGLSFDQVAVLKDSAGSVKLAEQRLAELVFKERPSLVIGGLDTAEADLLSRRAGELLLPTLVLSRDRTLAQRSTFVFNVYPDEQRLADTLYQAAARRGLKRFAVLRPTGGKSDKVVEHFKAAATAGGGRVVQDLTYTPQNFDSMQGVARQLFKTEAAERIDEYRAAYRRARRRAAAERVPFDPRMVVLRPIVDFDAVFLPDDFRTVRHFAKLFEFHMVEKLVMIGNHAWRSPALVEPFDEFLEGSFFADFIGSYAKLPPGVAAPTTGSPYFVHPQNVVAVDFRLIGYRVARTARLALKTPPPSRRAVNDALIALASDGGAFFGNGKVFDADRQSNWPTYLFNVSKGELQLDPTNLAVVGQRIPSFKERRGP